MTTKLSAIIHTLNEESNIANALNSIVSWVDEIVVVDMCSDDNTVEIAKSFGAKVFLHDKMGSADPARAFAEEQATGEWILVLDADELIPMPLCRVLLKIAEDDRADICYIPRLNYFNGRPLWHSGWGPDQDKIARFYRKGYFVHAGLIHTHPQPRTGSRIIKLGYKPNEAIIHFNYLNASHTLEKLNRYTDIEAQQCIRQGKHMQGPEMVLRTIGEFLNRYIRRQGFRDGWAGLYYSFLMAFYRATQGMKLRELEEGHSIRAVQEKYQAIAADLLSFYPGHSRRLHR